VSDPTTAEVVARLTTERDLLMQAVDALGPDATTIAVTEPGGWTAKDVLAHLIHYAGMIAFALGAPERPPPYVVSETRRLSGQEWNERAVAFWAEAPLADVRAEFERVTDALIAAAATNSDEKMRADHGVPWAAPGALWHFVGNDTYLHEWPAHRAQIEQARPAGSSPGE
jgi:hypothetical protein